MSRGPLIAAIAASLSLAVAACNGNTDEKNDYVDQVNGVTSTLNSGLTEITTQATAIAAPERASEVFSSFGASLDTAAAEISEISPPEEVADLHDQLVQQIRTLSSEATNAANEVKAGGAASVVGVAGQFVTEATRLSNEVDSTLSEINSELQE